MATIEKNILGNISGKVGSVVIRRIKGKTIICAKPANYKKSNSPQSILSKSRFKNLSIFASQINKCPVLKSIWAAHESKQQIPYRKIINSNFSFMDKEFFSDKNIIAPYTIQNPVKSVLLNEQTISLTLADDIFNTDSSSYRLDILLVFQKSLEPSPELITCFHLYKNIETGIFEHNFQLNKYEMTALQNYSELIVFSAITFAKDNKTNHLSHKGALFQLTL